MAQSQKLSSKSNRGAVLAVVAVALVVLAGLLLVQALGGDEEPADTASAPATTRTSPTSGTETDAPTADRSRLVSSKARGLVGSRRR